MKRFVISYSLRYVENVQFETRNFMMVEEGPSLPYVWRNFCDDFVDPIKFREPCILNVMEIESDLEWEDWLSCADKHHN